MRAEERAQNYLQQFEIQRLKILHAYSKMQSYYSKLTNNQELADTLSEEDKVKLEKTASDAARLFHKMDRFCAPRWGKLRDK